jgi:hypothetical protein
MIAVSKRTRAEEIDMDRTGSKTELGELSVEELEAVTGEADFVEAGSEIVCSANSCVWLP